MKQHDCLDRLIKHISFACKLIDSSL